MKKILENNHTVTTKSMLSNEEEIFSSLSTTALLAKGGVPVSHKRAADNYVIIKRIYKFQAVQSRPTIADLNLLKKYEFKPLEETTIKQINEELAFLKKWSLSSNETLAQDADEIIQIRAKELKNIIASRYILIDEEFHNGYKALERYFSEISKF